MSGVWSYNPDANMDGTGDGLTSLYAGGATVSSTDWTTTAVTIDISGGVFRINGTNLTGAVPGFANTNTTWDYLYVDDTSATTGTLNFQGGDKTDTAIGSGNNDTLKGGDGSDTLYGYNGNDLVSGEAGDDSLRGVNGNDTLDGGDGNDTLSGGSNDDLLYGGAGNDLLDGGTGVNVMYGGAGDDTINGNASGTDTIYGDAGKDSIVGGNNGDLIYGGADNDTITGNGGNDSIFGDAGDDLLLAGAGSDVVSGGAGNDTLSAGSGGDTLVGGAGNDVYTGSASEFNGDTVSGLEIGDQIVVTGVDLSSLNGTAIGSTASLGGANTLNFTGTSGTLQFNTSVTGGNTTLTISTYTARPLPAEAPPV